MNFRLPVSVAKNATGSLFSKPYSKLIIPHTGDNWSLSWDVQEISQVCKGLNMPVSNAHWAGVFRQSLFYVSKYFLLKPKLHLHGANRVTMAYYHGYPGEEEVANCCLENIRKYHHRISRIQITHQRIANVLLECGVSPEKLSMIPIGVNTDMFSPVTGSRRNDVRKKLGISDSAFVIGSFQKDGVGWGEGMSPKHIKGPDIFVDTVARVQKHVPELHVLLTGPARGYVKKELTERKIPFSHVYLNDFEELPTCYHALDAYVVSSREEGGPKAVLESMASGIPIISTPVGQATHLIDSGQNGFLSSGFSSEELAANVLRVYEDSALYGQVAVTGLVTAAENAYSAQAPLWEQFFDGIVRRDL